MVFFILFFYICISFSIFVILVDVFFSFLVSFSNISFVVILVEWSVCIPGYVSRTCSCVSIFSGHFRHFVSLYLPLKLFFTSNILVLALNIIDASWRVNSFMYLCRSPTFHLVFFLVSIVFLFFPHRCSRFFFLKKFFSWLEFISPVFISCVVLFIFSFILLVVSFHPFFVLSSIILLVSFSGCLCSFFSMLSLFLVTIVVMSSSPVSI